MALTLEKNPGNHAPDDAIKVRGEFHGTSSTGGEMSLFDVNGGSLTLNAGDRLLVTSVAIVTDTSADLAAFFGTGQTIKSGRTVARGTVGANGGIVREFLDPQKGPAGEGLRVKAGSSGTVDATMTGYLIRKGP